LAGEVPETTSPGTTSSSSPPASASQDLSQYLLTLDDLPSGWSRSPEQSDEDESSTTTDPPQCSSIGEEEFEHAQSELNQASADFQQSTFGPFVSNGIIAYEDSGQAEHALNTIVDGINACQTVTETDESGNETSYTFAPLSMDKHGDQTFATVLRGISQLGPIEGNLVFVQDGRYLWFVATVGLGAAPPIDISELVATAADRLP
jgi:PknH-like extracellular domain